jgi:hypothetical protein
VAAAKAALVRPELRRTTTARIVRITHTRVRDWAEARIDSLRNKDFKVFELAYRRIP